MLMLVPALFGSALFICLGVALVAVTAPITIAGYSTVLVAGLAAACLILTIRLAWAARWSVLLFGVLVPCGIVAVIGACLAWGWLRSGHHAEELRAEEIRHRAIGLTDPAGGVPTAVPAGLLAGSAQPPAYLATAPVMVPPVWWACAVWLEDRGLHEPWHLTGVDFGGVMRAYAASLTFRREGGSTIAEMIARELLELRPRPSAPLWEELPRKLASWSYGPAVHAVFPDDGHLAQAAATHLPLVIGARGSRFGPELHGLMRAAEGVFGKPPERLDAAEAAILAAAIKLPVVMAPADSATGRAAAERRFNFLRARADRCLVNAPLPDEVDRAAARTRLEHLPVPVLDRATRPSVAPATLFALPAELTQTVGPDWRARVANIATPRIPPGFTDAFAASVHGIEQHLGSDLETPLWEGQDHALVLAAVINSFGEEVLVVGNAGASLATTGPLPIASLGKIVAAIELGGHDRPSSIYRAPEGEPITAREAFAHSIGPPILARLAHQSDADTAEVFAALGWPVPLPGEARYNAVYGAVEVRPDQVLRAAGALTGILAGHPAPMPMPHAIGAITLTDGTAMRSTAAALPIEPLAARFTPFARAFVTNVLSAPVTQGTLHQLAVVAALPGVTQVWGKTGTGDSADKIRTRVVWQVGGLVYRGQPLSFLLLVAGTNQHPLGHITSVAVTPLTELLLRTAIRVSGSQR